MHNRKRQLKLPNENKRNSLTIVRTKQFPLPTRRSLWAVETVHTEHNGKRIMKWKIIKILKISRFKFSGNSRYKNCVKINNKVQKNNRKFTYVSVVWHRKMFGPGVNKQQKKH